MICFEVLLFLDRINLGFDGVSLKQSRLLLQLLSLLFVCILIQLHRHTGFELGLVDFGPQLQFGGNPSLDQTKSSGQHG